MFSDDTERMVRAIVYLEKHKSFVETGSVTDEEWMLLYEHRIGRNVFKPALTEG